MKGLKLTLTGLIVANAVLMVMLVFSFNGAQAQVADRGGEYLGVTGQITSTDQVLYLVNTRLDRMCVFFYSPISERVELYGNVDLKEAFATQVESGRGRGSR